MSGVSVCLVFVSGALTSLRRVVKREKHEGLSTKVTLCMCVCLWGGLCVVKSPERRE